MLPKGHARRALRTIACAVLAWSCGHNPTTDESQRTIEVTPPSLSLQSGETRGLNARLLDGTGASSGSARVFWSSENPSVATVSQLGIVTAIVAGNTNVAASLGGRSTIVPVTVTEIPVTLVRMSPATAEVRVGSTVAMRADAFRSNGAMVSGPTLAWASGDPAVASVSTDGVVSGVATGSATISATLNGVSGTAIVAVLAAPVAYVSVTPLSGAMLVGQSLQFTAVIRDAVGSPLSGYATAWSSSAPTVASVSSTGLVIAQAAGGAAITATSEGKSNTATITVSLVPVQSVEVVPRTATLSLGTTAQLFALVVDSTGAVLNGRDVAWSSSAPSIATVSAVGRVTAVADGQVRIVAMSEGKVGSASIVVTPTPVASIVVSPATAAIPLGATHQLTATPRDAQGRALPDRIVSWVSGGPTVATVDYRGLVTSVGLGTALIVATAEEQRALVTVIVSPASVAAVLLSPASSSLLPGQTVQLIAAARDASGNTITGRPATWSSTATSIATVTASGLVTAVATGTAQVTVSVEGVAATAVISVAPAPAVSVTVSPDPMSVVEGGSASVTATLRDAQGSVVTGATLSFSVADVAVAVVSATGVVTGVRAGATKISVTGAAPGQSTPVSGSAALTVAPAPPGRVVITAPAGPIHVGTLYARNVSAQAFDALNNPISGAQFVWSSIKPGLSVSGSGSSATITASGVPTSGLMVVATLAGNIPVADTATTSSDLVPIATLDVTPDTATLAPLQSQPLSATPKDSAGNAIGSSLGNPLGSRTVTWSLKSGVATISPNSGLATTVTAILPGPVVVQATLGGQTGAASITVTQSTTVDTIAAASGASPRITISAGTGHYSQEQFLIMSTGGNVMAGQSFTVTSSNPTVVTAVPAGSTSTDRKGEGEFKATLTSRARKGDSADITVSSGGKRTVWKLTVR